MITLDHRGEGVQKGSKYDPEILEQPLIYSTIYIQDDIIQLTECDSAVVAESHFKFRECNGFY